MDETKPFPTHAVLTMVTGRVWGPFGDAHEVAEHVMGHPIWTHELGSKALGKKLRRRILAQHPTLADVTDADCPTSAADVGARLGAQVARFGETMAIRRGSDVRKAHPAETLAAMCGRRSVVVLLP